MVTAWLTEVVAPAPRAGVLRSTSSGSPVVTLLLEAASRRRVVHALEAASPWLRTVKLTVVWLPGAPLVGLTDRFWMTRSGRPLPPLDATVNGVLTRSLASFAEPCPAVLLTSAMTHT